MHMQLATPRSLTVVDSLQANRSAWGRRRLVVEWR